MDTVAYCTQCGTPRNLTAKYCGQCGQVFKDSASELRWRVDVPLITNRFVVYDVFWGGAATVAISALVLLIAMGFGDGWRHMGRIIEVTMIMAGGAGLFIALISVFTLLVFFGNRCPLEFVLSTDGVLMKNASERAKFIHRFAWVLAIVTGKPLMAGPGLIAQSTEIQGIPWHEVKNVKSYPNIGVITVRGQCFDKLRIYCTKENYATVQSFIEQNVRAMAPQASLEV